MVETRKIYGDSYQRVYSAALSAARQCGFQIDTEDANGGMIKASAGTSLWSWGEAVNIKISSVSSGVEVTLSSSAKAQLFDWGKSEENVNTFFQTLERYLEEQK